MATCRKCGAKVGCGCQLVDGLCPSCRQKAATPPPPPPPPAK